MEKEETWVAVDGHGDERIFSIEPWRSFPNMDLSVLWGQRWATDCDSSFNKTQFGTLLPKGTIKKLIGKELTYADEPVQIL